MTLHPDIAAKIAKIIPRLASEHEGEVIATVRAIARTLTTAGSDWHALAATVAPARPTILSDLEGFDWDAVFKACRKAERRAQRRDRVDPSAPEAPARQRGYPIWGTKRIEPWHVVAGHCLQIDWLTPKAFGGKAFTVEEKDRLRAYERSRGLVTNAAAAWIKSMVVRCHAARDRARASAP